MPIGCIGLIQPMFLNTHGNTIAAFASSARCRNQASLVPGFGDFFFYIRPYNRISEYLWNPYMIKFRCCSDSCTGISNVACNLGNGSTLYWINWVDSTLLSLELFEITTQTLSKMIQLTGWSYFTTLIPCYSNKTGVSDFNFGMLRIQNACRF